MNITDEMVKRYREAWISTPQGAPGDRTRAGLAAVLSALGEKQYSGRKDGSGFIWPTKDEMIEVDDLVPGDRYYVRRVFCGEWEEVEVQD